MKTRLRIPRILQEYADGELELQLSGKTVSDVLADLRRRCPAVYECVCDETGTLRRHINIFLNENLIIENDFAKTRLNEGDIVSVFQAVSGG